VNTVPPTLDARFRAEAAAEGLLDVAYDVLESPVGDLFVGVSDRGLCVISYDTDAEDQAERLARGFGSRVLRSPRPIEPTKRQLHEYFEGKRRRFDLDVDLRLSRDSAVSCSRSSAASRSARSRRTAHSLPARASLGPPVRSERS